MTGECDCGRPPGQCIKGDLDYCDAWEEQEEVDEEDIQEAECGRWDNGALVSSCRLAGTEWCDWECPIGLSRRRYKSR